MNRLYDFQFKQINDSMSIQDMIIHLNNFQNAVIEEIRDLEVKMLTIPPPQTNPYINHLMQEIENLKEEFKRERKRWGLLD